MERIGNTIDKCRILRDRYESLEEALTRIDYEPPFLRDIINRNKDGLSNLQRIATERKEDLETRLNNDRYIDKREESVICDLLNWYTTLREHFFDNLERSVNQRRSPDACKDFACIDKIILDILDYIGRRENLIVIYSKGRYFTEFATKTISFAMSDMKNPINFAILAHEISHAVLAPLSLSLQTLLHFTYSIKDEFSRRFGAERIFLDKLVGTDFESKEAKNLIQDISHYFRTNEEALLLYINELLIGSEYESERSQEELSQISREILDRTISFIPDLLEHISTIEDYISKGTNEDWISEIMADIVATKVMGPAYFEVLLKTLWMTEQTNWKTTHPPTLFRLFFSEKTLNLMNMKDIPSELIRWREYFPAESLRELTENESFLVKLFNFVNGHLEKVNTPRICFTSEDYSKSLSYSDCLGRGDLNWGTKEKAPVVLNSASIAIRRGIDSRIVKDHLIKLLS
ncbi:MAG: hypothetical protein OEW87_08590 [Flavobacteriaceae bacterium]|nr:hypothetical protein [Flavobacteriaceae bacterium]